MDIKEKAVNYHDRGFNCAQAVFAANAECLEIDEKTALAVSAGFGGGLRSGEICGAISGAVMALGMAYPYTDGKDTVSKDKIAELAKSCVSAAKEKFGCVRCVELKGDKSKCPYYIAEMAAYTETIINNK